MILEENKHAEKKDTRKACFRLCFCHCKHLGKFCEKTWAWRLIPVVLVDMSSSVVFGPFNLRKLATIQVTPLPNHQNAVYFTKSAAEG